MTQQETCSVRNTDKIKGGLGFFFIRDFIDGLKVAWINHYTKGTEDHWCDIIYSDFNFTIETRRELLRM